MTMSQAVQVRRNEINMMKSQISQAVPKTITSDRMMRSCITAVSQNPRLAMCTKESFLGAMMQVATLGLEPNTPLGHAYLIPYKQHCQLQIGYKGILELARRTGMYQNIYAMEVYANDDFSYQYGLDMDLKHIPAENPEGDPVRYYAVFKLTNGGVGFKVWSRDKVQKHGQRFSKAYHKSDSPWQTNFDAMAKKTVLLDLLKTAPMSAEMGEATYADNAIVAARMSNGQAEFEYERPELPEPAEIQELPEAQEEPHMEEESNEDEINAMLSSASPAVAEEPPPAPKPKATRPKASSAPKRKIVKAEIKETITIPSYKDREAHMKEHAGAYRELQSYIETERIKLNKKLLQKLLTLKEMAIKNSDMKNLATGVRAALNNDFKDIEFLLRNVSEFES
jgi:recombination protein RecT